MKHLAPLLFAVAILPPALVSHAGVVFENSFEFPAVTGRTPRAAGGDISKANPAKPVDTQPAWSCFEDQPNIGAEGGGVVAGLTNQVARTGTQALFIEATKLSLPYLGALFVSRLIPVAGGKSYKASIWGRNDATNPLSLATAQLFLKMRVDFYTDEGKTETGESQYLLLPLPGSKGRPLSIVTTGWNCLGLRFSAPAGAKYLVVSFRCDANAEQGDISGTVYFDDFTVATEPLQPGAEGVSKPTPTPSNP
ncbi:MAG: hypothetical protein WCO68_07440 [Verrucomicrobiota bacterium]